jgi:beta-xylosidase
MSPKSALTVLWIFLFWTTACVSPKPLPDERAIETFLAETLNARAFPISTDTPMPKETLIGNELPPIPTPASQGLVVPSATPAFLFRDDFNLNSNEGWFWEREDPQRWSLSENPGSLRLYLKADDCQGLPSNIPLIKPPEGNYELVTKLDFTPVENFQFAGLMIYQDDGNNLRFGRAFCNIIQECVGNGVYFDYYRSGKPSGSNYAAATKNLAQIFLRLQRENNDYTGFYSEDGENWQMAGQHASDISPIGVGLVAGQSCGGGLAADFDYFSVKSLP